MGAPDAIEVSVPAFVLFSSPAPDAAAVASALTPEFAEIEILTSGPDGEVLEAPVVCARHGEDHLLAAVVPAPVPDDEALLACHPVWWDDVDPVAHHASQVVVVVRSTDDSDEDPRARALRQAMTASVAIAALLGLADAVAVYVGAASATFPAAGYVEYLDAARAEESLPVELWVTTWLEPHEDGTVSGWTHGLAPFGHAELAVEDSRREPSEVYGMLSSLVAHVVLTGDGLATGHTLGWDGETLPVSELAEEVGVPVLSIGF